jgi:hypothetical protein
MAVVKGTAMWASITKPNTTYAPVYTINVIPEDASMIEKFRNNGHNIKTTDDGQEYVVIKRSTTWPSGDPKDPPRLVDAGKNPVDVLVGNGSIVNVQYDEYSGKNKYGNYKGLELKAVQVLELVEYAGADGDEFDSEADDDEF